MQLQMLPILSEDEVRLAKHQGLRLFYCCFYKIDACWATNFTKLGGPGDFLVAKGDRVTGEYLYDFFFCCLKLQSRVSL